MFLAIGIRVIADNGSTVRKVVLDVTRDDVEMATTLTNRQFTATSATGNYVTQRGDRLVIEVGAGGDPTGSNPHDFTLRLGDSAASDLPENDTATTDDNPWIELTDTLTFSLDHAYRNASAAWPMDETSGTRVDIVGESDLTDNNTVASAAGKFGNAADFELTNSEYLSVADNTAVSFSGASSSGRCWINLESKTADMAVIFKYDNTGDQREYALQYVTASDRLRLIVSNDGAATNIVTADNFGAVPTATWILVHFWVDTTNSQIGISVNAGTPNLTTHNTGIFNSTSPFVVGAFSDGLEQWFDGLIDDVVLLRGYVMDQAERIVDYNSGTGKAFTTWPDADLDVAIRNRPYGLRGAGQMSQLLSR